MTTIEFIPQAWVDDYAVETNAEGPRTFEVEHLTQEQIDALWSDSLKRDNYQTHPNAPEWVKNWSGPFELYIYND